jgi:predicted membrane-bound spermidine synthase
MARLAAAFFCSGFGALLCQVVWQRMLGIFAGSDTVSAALVAGAFLTGLGVGSLAGAKAADRLTPARALLGFALCEAGVAGFALLSKPFLYDLLAVGLAGVVDAPAAVFAMCFAGMALPTALMGASLPLLARAVADSLDTVAERIGWLYGLNTLGAGAGALAGGWLLVGNVGFVGTLFVAAALDVGAALLALGLLPALRARSAPVPGRTAATPAAPAAGPAAPAAGPAAGASAAPFGGLPLWCGLVFLSGYVIVALEIVWVRLLGQVGQFHAYLFPTVLGVFLLADGAGIAVASRLVRRLRDPRPAFFLAQAGGFVLAAALILALWLALPHWPLRNYLLVDQWRLGGRSFLATVVLTVLVVGPPSFLIGMTFPLVQRAVQRDLATVGARVGWVQLANIAGNAAGSVGTGLVSLHFLGTAGTLRLLAALSLALLVGWLWRAAGGGGGGGGRGWRRAPELALAAACAAALVAVPSNAAFWNRMHGLGPGAFAAWAEDRSGVAFFRDEAPAAGPPTGRFFIAGFAQGSIPFQAQHLLLGAAGPLLHPDPRRVLLVGVGSGGTPWGALVSPGVEELRAVEIIGPVLTALGAVARREPEGAVAALLADPRTRLEYGDGRRAVAGAAAGRYDVIEADAVRPESSHSGLLYSEEFFEQVRGRLAPGGLCVQWTPTRRAVETFAAVFPHAVLLRPANIMVGSDSPIPADAAERLLARLAEPAAAAHLARGGPAAAQAAGLLDPARTLTWRPGDPRGPAPLTDMFPRDELFVNNGIDETWQPEPPAAGRQAATAGR